MTDSFSLTPNPLSTKTRTGSESREPKEQNIRNFCQGSAAKAQTWHVHK